MSRSIALLLFVLAAVSPPAWAGPVILGGDDLTDHGSLGPLPGPGNNVIVPESEANNSAATANPIALGDDFTGAVSDAFPLPGTGATVNESEDNGTAATADVANVGDDYTGNVSEGELAAGNPIIVNESEPNQTVATADMIALGNRFSASLALGASIGSGMTINESEPNDTFGTADPVALGDDLSGAANPAGDEDWFSFTGTAGDVVSIQVIAASGPGPTIVSLIESDGMTFVSTLPLAADDGQWGVLPSTGTFYVRVISCCGETNSYTLRLRKHTGGDAVDVVKFTVPGATRIAVSAGDNFPQFITLLDTDGTTVLDSSLGGMETDLPAAGTYFVQVDRFLPVSYTLRVQAIINIDLRDFVSVTVAGPTDLITTLIGGDDNVDVQVRDTDGTTVLESGDSIVTALPAAGTYFVVLLADGPSTPYTLQLRESSGMSDEEDFISFAVAAPTSIVASVLPGPGVSVDFDLLDTDGTSFLSGTTFDNQIAFDLPAAGTYYLRVEEDGIGAGTYTLQLRTQAGTVLREGWEYIRQALGGMIPQVTRPGNDGSIAALGAAPSMDTDGDAGAAIAAAAAALGVTVVHYEGAAAINQFFLDLTNGTVNPAIIWTAGTDASNDLDADEGAALTANAARIASFVRSGGGLMSHGSGPVAYGWLTTLIPTITNVEEGDSDDLFLTPAGLTALPLVTLPILNSGPWHSYFDGDLQTLQALVRSSNVTDSNGNPAAVILGGQVADLAVRAINPAPLLGLPGLGLLVAVLAALSVRRLWH